MRILIVSPLKKESAFLLQGLAGRGFQTEDAVVGRLPVVQLPEIGVTLACGGTGKAQFALQMQHLLDASTGWDMAICAGAAGGLVDDLATGDVVVATSTVEHDYNNRFSSTSLPRFEGHPPAIDLLRSVSMPTCSFRVHFGRVASGDEDIVDAERRASLQQSTGAVAVAWEGAGGARACKFSGVPFLEVRGITDAADHSAPSDFEKNLEIAMHNIALLIASFSGHMRDV